MIDIHRKTKFIDIVLMIILFLFVFNAPLSEHINSAFSYIDDVTMVILILIFGILIIRKKGKVFIGQHEKIILISFGLMYVLGLIGNIISEFQNNLFAILVDMLSWTKFFIAYVGLVNILKEHTANKYYGYLKKFSKFMIIIGIILEILNLTTDIELTLPWLGRYGIKAFALFSHPTFASAIFVGLTSILLVEPKKNAIWILLGLILIGATLRTKSIAFIGMIIYSLLFFRKKINIFKVVIIGVLVVIVGYSQIQFYFLDFEAPRAKLLSTSIKIANEYFPTGSGFATFGTTMSGKFYSKAYEKYGLNNNRGLTEDSYSYIGDGGWASIIGEFGYIGTALFLLMIVCVILSIKSRIYQSGVQFLPYISLLGYLLISSTNETAFNSNYTVLYAIILAIIVKKQQKDTDLNVEEKITKNGKNKN